MVEPKPRILLVEDDAKLSKLMQEFLQYSGELTVDVEPRGDIAVDRILSEDPALVVLDIMLPGIDGLEVCRRVRSSYDGPILMLTALSDEVDEIVGLEIGADDYLAKPVSPRLLLARIRTLLRRSASEESSAHEPATPLHDGTQPPPTLRIGELVVDSANRTASLAGEVLDLTTAEFDLLHFLAARAGTIVNRETIYQEIRGIEWDGLDRSVDQRVRRLRKKLGDDARHPTWIKSVRGQGYLMVASS